MYECSLGRGKCTCVCTLFGCVCFQYFMVSLSGMGAKQTDIRRKEKDISSALRETCKNMCSVRLREGAIDRTWQQDSIWMYLDIRNINNKNN